MSRRFTFAVGLVSFLVLGGSISALASRSANNVRQGVPIPVLPPAKDFVGKIDNLYFPLTPGTVLTYRGRQDGQPREVTITVTHDTKTILGIRAVVVFDEVRLAGQPEERTFDWYAQDKQGNVWYLGEDSFDFVNGTWVKSGGSWLAGVDGAKAGMIMKGHREVGDIYRQEYFAGHAEDMAQILDTNASLKIPFGSFDHMLVTKEWTPLKPDVVENKYYARGIGEVRNLMVKGGVEEMNLVSVSHGG
jgi:hypothetical protein